MPFHLYKGDDEPEKNKVGKHTDMISLCICNYALLTYSYILLSTFASSKKKTTKSNMKSSNGTVSKQTEDMNCAFYYCIITYI